MPIVVPSMLIQRLAPGARKSLQGEGIDSGTVVLTTGEVLESPLSVHERRSPFSSPLEFAVLILGSQSPLQQCHMQSLPLAPLHTI